MSLVNWSVPGTTKPERCDIFELMKREDRGQRVTSSEVVISYHYLSEDVAREITERVLTAEEATVFNQLRVISPSQFQPPRVWWKIFQKRRTVTWLDYAEAIGHDMNSFWLIWDGVGAKIMSYLKANPSPA